MPELTEIQKDLQALAAGLKQLEAEYNMFFSGRLPRPPWETRNRVDGADQEVGPRLHPVADGSLPVRHAAARASRRSSTSGIAACARARKGGPARSRSAAAEQARKPKDAPDAKVVHVTAFQDPMREMDKLHTLYDSLMDARREAGDDVVPFHRFAALVKDQVTKLKSRRTEEVAFRVAVVDGKVNFTARGVKGTAREANEAAGDCEAGRPAAPRPRVEC